MKKDKGLGTRGDKLPIDSPPRKQLLPGRARKYLKEPGKIEDMPSAEELQKAEKLEKSGRLKK
jgi:hypothetical protein